MKAKKRKREDDTKSKNPRRTRFKRQLNYELTNASNYEKSEINAIATKVSIDSANSDPLISLMNSRNQPNPDISIVVDNPNTSKSESNEASYTFHQDVPNKSDEIIVNKRRDDFIETKEMKKSNRRDFISNNSIDVTKCIPKQITLTKSSLPHAISQNNIKDPVTHYNQMTNAIFEKRIEKWDLDSQTTLDEDCHNNHFRYNKGFTLFNFKQLFLCLIILSLLLIHFAILIYNQLHFIYELKMSNEDLQQTVNWLNTQIQIQEKASVAAVNEVALISSVYKAQQFFEYTSNFEKRLQFQIAESIDAVNMVASMANQRKDQLIKDERDLIIDEAIKAINTVSMSASELHPLENAKGK